MQAVHRLLPLLLLLLGATPALFGRASAQDFDRGVLAVLGGTAEDRLRVAQLLGAASPDGFLLRSAATLSDVVDELAEDTVAPPFRQLLPRVETVWNSDLPFSLNDGALWAGRGFNLLATTGFRFRSGPVRLVVAPEVVYEENLPFQTIIFQNSAEERRSIYAHPFHPSPQSIDTPLRFGADSRTRAGLGQSSLTVELGPVATGLATENLWWGPGIRNALVMSSHAEGFPHLFLATPRPLQTPLGAVEGRWIVGRLMESEFFDWDPSNDHASLSAVALTLAPAFEPDLTVGFARAVFAPLDEDETGIGATFDVFTSVGRPNSKSEPEPGPDQIFSLFGRWVFPGAGFEVYGEWARFEEAASVSDFLELPNHSQGYTVGLQWARTLGGTTGEGVPSDDWWPDASLIRVQAEITNVEPASTFRVRPAFSSYTSRAVLQGYTHRGQVLGASIGPASSSQWLAVDYLRPGWWLGGFWGRIRADNDVLFSSPVVRHPKREDVTIFWGLRGGTDVKGIRVDARVSTAIRLNYLFQALAFDGSDGVDIPNHTLGLTLSRALGADRGDRR